MKIKQLLGILFLCMLCGCSQKETTDSYLSLKELLTTERSAEGTDITESSGETPKEQTTREDSEQDTTKTDAPASQENSSSEQENPSVAPSESMTITEQVPPRTLSATTASEQISVSMPLTPANHFFSNSYSNGIHTLVFSPREIYYENGMLYATMYVYNGHDTTVTDIRNIYLSFDNGATAVAEAFFEEMKHCSISPHSYVLWNFTFPAEGVYQTTDSLQRINTTYESTYHY